MRMSDYLGVTASFLYVVSLDSSSSSELGVIEVNVVLKVQMWEVLKEIVQQQGCLGTNMVPKAAVEGYH